jgi:hypothetical protein
LFIACHLTKPQYTNAAKVTSYKAVLVPAAFL